VVTKILTNDRMSTLPSSTTRSHERQTTKPTSFSDTPSSGCSKKRRHLLADSGRRRDCRLRERRCSTAVAPTKIGWELSRRKRHVPGSRCSAQMSTRRYHRHRRRDGRTRCLARLDWERTFVRFLRPSRVSRCGSADGRGPGRVKRPEHPTGYSFSAAVAFRVDEPFLGATPTAREK
jgi:hypothetical protein